MILLTPGPATTSDAVRYALQSGDVCHREAQFCELIADIRHMLCAVAGARTHDVVLFAGSGSCAVEAAITAVPRHGRLLVIDNGAYGQRIAQIAQIHAISHYRLDAPWHRALPLDRLERLLATGAYTHVAMVHHETSTGMLNPLEAVAELCERHRASLIVDAMSSFGGSELSFEHPAIDLVVAGANKCVEALPGMCFVFVRRSSWPRLQASAPRSFYANLVLEHEAMRETGQMRFTPPVQVAFALHQALVELEVETIANRAARYRDNWQTLAQGMAELGFARLLAPELESGLLSSFVAPTHPAWTFQSFQSMLAELGFLIYPPKSDYVHTFRIGNIGRIYPEDLERFIAAAAEVLQSLGVLEQLYPEDR